MQYPIIYQRLIGFYFYFIMIYNLYLSHKLTNCLSKKLRKASLRGTEKTRPHVSFSCIELYITNKVIAAVCKIFGTHPQNDGFLFFIFGFLQAAMLVILILLECLIILMVVCVSMYLIMRVINYF